MVVLCGAPQYTDESPPSLTNPELLMEVTSESTSDRDHQDKPEAYLNLGSLQEYWIASPSPPSLHSTSGAATSGSSARCRDATPCFTASP